MSRSPVQLANMEAHLKAHAMDHAEALAHAEAVSHQVASISTLVVYPLKSAAGVAMPRAELTPRGLRHDRCWCVMNPDGLVQDQRVRPMLSMVMPAFDGDELVLNAPAETALAPLRLPLAEEAYAQRDGAEVSDRHEGKWFGKPLAARYAGDEAAEWITAFFAFYDAQTAGTPLSDAITEASAKPFAIMRYVAEADRLISEAFNGKSVLAKIASRLDTTPPTAGFADCAPLHVASYDSLAELNRRLAERGEDAVMIDRFRPNIIVGKPPLGQGVIYGSVQADGRKAELAPHVEDTWHEVRFVHQKSRFLAFFTLKITIS